MAEGSKALLVKARLLQPLLPSLIEIGNGYQFWGANLKNAAVDMRFGVFSSTNTDPNDPYGVHGVGEEQREHAVAEPNGLACSTYGYAYSGTGDRTDLCLDSLLRKNSIAQSGIGYHCTRSI